MLLQLLGIFIIALMGKNVFLLSIFLYEVSTATGEYMAYASAELVAKF